MIRTAAKVTGTRRAAGGLGVTLVPNASVHQIQPTALYRPLTDRAGIVELSLVSRDTAHEPLAEHFLRIATRHGFAGGPRF